MENSLKLQQTASWLLCTIVVTIPLIFGAVHPIVQGSYSFVMLVLLGGWLLLNYKIKSNFTLSFWLVVPLLLIGYIVLQSIPLPLSWVELLSFARADRIGMVNELAGTNLQYITLSETGSTGLYKGISLLAILFYFFSLRQLLDTNDGFCFLLVYCLIGVGIFEALYGLIQFVNPQIGMLWLKIKSRAAHGTIIYKNQYASMLNMIWPLALAAGSLYFMKKKSRGAPGEIRNTFTTVANKFSTTKVRAPLFIFGAVIMVLAVFFSLSRGGILGMVLTAILLAFLLPFSTRSKIIFFLVFGCLLLGYGMILGFDTIISRFGSLDRSGGHRIDIYLSSLPMLVDHWLTGIGMEAYRELSPVYLKGFPVNTLYDRVHNEYMELAIELGIPAAILLFSWGGMGIFTLFISITKFQRMSDRTILAIASFCGLVTFLIHGCIDFGWRLPVNLVYAVTLLGICTSCIEYERRKLLTGDGAYKENG